MTDILIRNVPDDELREIDRQAGELGLSRGEFLRREISSVAARRRSKVSSADFEWLAELTADLADEDVMRHAWS